MAWEVTFTQNTDEPGVGGTSATYTPEPTGDPYAFGVTHGRRVDTNNPADLDLFKTECETALAEENTRRIDEAAAAARTEAVLNGQ